MAVLMFIVNIIIILSLSNLKEVNIPLLYDYQSEMMFCIAKIGTNTSSFFYPISISSKFSVIYTFGKEDLTSSTLIITQNSIYQSTNNLTGTLAIDSIHFGENTLDNFEFVYNTDQSPVNWRSFRGILSLSRSQYAFHNKLYQNNLISQRIIEYNDQANLKIGGYNLNKTFGTCSTIENIDNWSCKMIGFGVGEIGHYSKTIETNKFRNYLMINELVSFHSMEIDITVPYEYLEWFKVHYFGINSKGIMNDGCNEVEDEDSLGNVIFKIACFDKLENTYSSITLFLGDDLAITLHGKEIFNKVELQDKFVHVFRIQFKEKLKEWNIGWRILKNNNAVFNHDNNTISFALNQNVFLSKPKFPIGAKLIITVISVISSFFLLSGVCLLGFTHCSSTER